MNHFLIDLRHAVRLLGKRPGFSITVVLVLTLGIGANSAIFSVVNAVLLHPFPYKDSDRIVFIGSTPAGQQGTMPVTYPDYEEWTAQARKFEQLAYVNNRSFTLTDVTEPANVPGAVMTASAWPLLGLSPILGRTFTPAEDRPGADPVCVISQGAWQNRFSSDPAIINRQIMLDGRAHTIVGVMPAQFKFWAAEIWTPVGLEADTDLMRSRVLRMGAWVVGKLKVGVTLEEATADLTTIAERIAREHEDTNKGVGVSVVFLSQSVTGGFRTPLMVLLGAVACVLLVACANVANLLLAQAATREREFAIRTALGASKSRVVMQMLVESLPLAVLGGVGGLLLATWGLNALLLFIPADSIPVEAQIRIDGSVMAYTALLSLGTTLLFALLPAFMGARDGFNEALKEGSRGTSGRRSGRLRSGLIVAEVSLSLTLLVGAGLLIRSFARLQAADPGFNAQNLLVLPVQLPTARYVSGLKATQFFEELVERCRQIPGVKAVGAGANIPFRGGSGLPLLVESKTYADLNELQGVQFNLVMGDYFRAQGLKLLQGRLLSEKDRQGSEPVVILNDAAVKRFLPDGDPLGKRVMLGLPENLIKPGMLPPGLDKFQWTTVVGVVQSARHFGLQGDPVPTAYLPVDQSWQAPLMRTSMFVLLRTEGDPTQVASMAREALWGIDRNQPAGRIMDMDTIIRETLQQSRFSMILLVLFAIIAVILAAVGIYGVVAWNVTQRTREIGIRQALGATREEVHLLIVRQGMRTVLYGLLVGLVGAVVVTRALQSLLFEVSAHDPWTFVAVSALLGLIALLACVIPARRATRVDPMVALREDG
ncbi:MAG: ABC transporter permease [Opitutaceae bacterium]